MLYKTKDFPEDNELVMCTVKNILHSAVFVRLDEYKKDGMINISEVSPGRIRNLRDYVTEGKKIVCKVLRTDKVKGHIDLSLRRVNQAQRINKNKEYKNEIKAERILEAVAKTLKKDVKFLDELGRNLINKFGNLYGAFQGISEDNNLIKEFKIDKKIEKAVLDIVNERIKPEEITIKAYITLTSKDGEGINKIKNTFNKLKRLDVKIAYASAPKYSLIITAKDYKKGEEILKNVTDGFVVESKNNNCEFSIKRQ